MRILNPKELEGIYQMAYEVSCDFSLQYHSSLSPDNWNVNRPADRQRYFDTQYRNRLMEASARAQHQQDLKDFMEWGDEPCPHCIGLTEVEQLMGRSVAKRECDDCWDGLKQLCEEGGDNGRS